MLVLIHVRRNLKFSAHLTHIAFQECFPGSKYKFKVDNDVYQMMIVGPKVEDSGKYTIEISGIQSTAFLNVDGNFFRFPKD